MVGAGVAPLFVAGIARVTSPEARLGRDSVVCIGLRGSSSRRVVSSA